jgi:hypothetical protein
MRTTAQPDPTIQAKKHSRLDARPPAPRTHIERRTTSIFLDRRHQAR